MATDKRLQRTFDWERLERLSVLELWTPDEIFDNATQDTLAKFYEDQRVERKSAGIHADSLATYVCMWANTPPDGGVMALGVEDDGSVTGCSARSEQLVEVERRIRSELVPDAVFGERKVLVRTV